MNTLPGPRISPPGAFFCTFAGSRFKARLRLIAMVVLLSGLFLASLWGPLAKDRPPGQPIKQGSTFLWRVQSPTATVYLLGSIHVAPPELYPLAPIIEKSYRESQVLVVEADVGRTRGAMAGLVRKYGMYPDGKGLKADLPPRLYEILQKRLGELGMSPVQVEGMRPWLVATMLSVMQLSRAGYKMSGGIDNYFLTKARGRKPIEELESAEYQLRMFASFPPPMQNAFLEQTLTGLPELKKTLAAMLGHWKRGNIDEMEKLVFPNNAVAGSDAIDERIYFARNRAMAKKIRVYLTGRRTVFVVVGAGHMLGDRGIPALLASGEKKKYRITRY